MVTSILRKNNIDEPGYVYIKHKNEPKHAITALGFYPDLQAYRFTIYN